MHLKFSVFKAFCLICIVGVYSLDNNTKENELSFSVKIVNVDYKTAEFEIVDDYSTGTNYLVMYNMNSQYEYIDRNGISIKESDSTSNKFEIQTNTKQVKKSENEVIDFTFWDNGVKLSEKG